MSDCCAYCFTQVTGPYVSYAHSIPMQKCECSEEAPNSCAYKDAQPHFIAGHCTGSGS